MDDLCELVRLNNLGRLYGVKHALEAHGISAEIFRDCIGGKRYAAGSGKPRLMIPQRDLVYARWVAHAAGLDTWPDEPGESEGREAQACSAPSRKAG